MRKTDQMTLAVNAALTVEEYGREALEAGTVAYAGDGAPVYEPGDSGVYDLTTESGRRAWKANAPEGVTRTIIEDSEPWLDSVVGMFSEQLADWMEGRGATLQKGAARKVGPRRQRPAARDRNCRLNRSIFLSTVADEGVSI